MPEPTGRTYFDRALVQPAAVRAPEPVAVAQGGPVVAAAGGQADGAARVLVADRSCPSRSAAGSSSWRRMPASGGPDMRGARAFLAGPRQGVTYGANVWHHPLTILDRPARFAVFMWLDGGKGDEEFFALPAPVTIAAS